MNQEELRKEAADKYVLNRFTNSDNKDYFNERSTFKDFIAGAEFEAEKQKWIEFEKMTPEEAQKLNNHPENLTICKFDNGDILRYDQEFPFAELIQVFLLPIPPKTSK